MSVGMVELEVLLHILFVTFQAMKRSGHASPIGSEDVHDRCMQRLAARASFDEGLPGNLADQVVQQFCDEHPERYLLASVYGYLGEYDLLHVCTDAEKYLLTAALHLAGCVAFVAILELVVKITGEPASKWDAWTLARQLLVTTINKRID